MRQLQIHNKPTYRSNILKPFLDKIGKYDVLEAIQEVALSKIIKWETLTSEEEDSLKGLVHWKQYRDIFIIKEKKELLATLNWDTKKQNNSETADNIKKWNNLGITEQQAIQVLTVCNLRFVVSVAKQYTNRPWADLSELIEEWTIWLTKAATRFDATRWFKFISYAVRWIRQKILQSLSENEFIRKPANQTALNKKIWKFEEQFIQKEGRLPSKEEIETELEITEKQYENYLSAYLTENIWSLDATFGDDDERTLWDIIPNNTPSPASLIEQNTDRSGLAKFLEQRLNSDKDTQQYKQAFACALKFWLNPGWVNPDGVGIERADGEIVEIFHKKGISIIDEKYIEKCQKKGILIKTDIETEIELVQTLITNAKRKLSKRVKPDWDVKDNYLVKHISKSDIDISIPDIVLKASEEEIKQALNRLSEKKWTETQAKVLSLRYWIPSKFNPDWKKHTIKEIAWQIERREGSVKTTLISAIEKLEIVLSQPKIIFQPQSSTPSSNDIPQSKILTDPQKDVSDVDYRRSLIEEALIRLEKKTTEREKWPEIFRLYYWLNDNWKVRDVEAIMWKTEKKYPALMAAKKRTEKAILGILEGVNPIKMADILKKLRKSNTAATKDVLKEPKKDINNSKTSPETWSKNSGSNDIWNDKVYAEPRDASEVDYWKWKIEEALIILENKIKKTIWLRIFRLYYWLNDNWKPYDGHTIAETEVKKPYTTTMHIRKGIEKKILDTIEWINSSKLNKILENLKQSYRTTIIVDKTRDVSDVKYRRSQIEKALNLLKQEQESERKKGNRKIDRCKVFNLYYNSVNPDDWKLYTAKKIAKKERISWDSYVTHILENTKKEIRYKLGIDSFTMDEILKNLRKSNNAGIKQVLEEPQPETQDIPKNINDSAPKEPEKESPEAQNIPQSEIPTDPQKDASIPTKITDIPDVIDLESKIKTALEELRQEIENEQGRGKSNRQRNWCDVLNLYYFSVNPGDWKLYSNDKIANQLWISAGTYVSTILKKTKTRLAEKLWIDTDTLADILKNLRERNRDSIKNILEQPHKNTENLKQ